ncbi:MAG: glycosidase [Verrucomicrobiaceae bacterium]|nr:MAG: glycosidase [Verrucomicrobiaceae bacterium]
MTIRRHEITLEPDSARVIVRPFIPSDPAKIAAVLERALELSEEEVSNHLKGVRREFEERHYDMELVLSEHYSKVARHMKSNALLSRDRELLIGALFSGEYSLESAALFNPSIVPHPDQSGVAEGGLRFIMSLRATGEGHISSIEFRSGVIHSTGDITLDPVSRYVSLPQIVLNPTYRKKSFILKFHEMGFDDKFADEVMEPLAPEFNRTALEESISRIGDSARDSHHRHRTLECIQWLADSNYELSFSSKLNVSERIIFPVSPNESNGIEDARFVKLTQDDGTALYCATYTAYNGKAILPQFIETRDFLHFRILTLNGTAVQNKGMALFPRTINGHYAMLSRQDDENLFIMFSDNLHYWNDPKFLLGPKEVWESVKIGNCGSPIETEDGWLVITHGVGPLRKYSIGVVLLDLDDPTKVIGRLRDPLVSAEGNEREGYVPNVVYSCGSMLHGDHLILPYAMSDKFTAIASVNLKELLTALKAAGA